MNKQCGIYLLTHTKSGKIYVGQSINIKRRWWSHGAGGKRTCPKLHNAINKHGKDSFVCTILELTDVNQLTEREQHYLDTLKPFGTRGYNISTVATPGVYNKGKKKTGRVAAGKPNCRNKSVCQYDETGLLLATYYSIKDAAKHVNVNYMGITNCIKGRSRTAGGFFWALEGTLPNIRPRGSRLGQSHTEETKQKIGEGNKKAWAKSPHLPRRRPESS